MRKGIKKLISFFATVLVPFSVKAYTTITDHEGVTCHVSRYDDGCYTADITPYCRTNGGNYQCMDVTTSNFWGDRCGNPTVLEEACHADRRNYSTCTCLGCTTLAECQKAPDGGTGGSANCYAVLSVPNYHLVLYNVCDPVNYNVPAHDDVYVSWSSIGAASCQPGYYGLVGGVNDNSKISFDECEKCPDGGTSAVFENENRNNCFKKDQSGSDATGAWVIPGMCYYG